VNKVGSDHVGLLVAGAFNASVGRDAIPADLVPSIAGSASTTSTENSTSEPECWRSTSDPARQLAPGLLAALQVTAYDFSASSWTTNGDNQLAFILRCWLLLLLLLLLLFRVSTSRGIITIFGSMLAPHTGPLLKQGAEAKTILSLPKVDGASPPSLLEAPDTHASKRKRKKIKTEKGDNDVLPKKEEEEEQGEQEKKKKKKKKKKTKKREEGNKRNL